MNKNKIDMKKTLILLLFASILYSCNNRKAANQNISLNRQSVNNVRRIKVLTLGTFHFAFPNLDVVKVDKENQIDVLDSKYQKEIKLIVDDLAKFHPTKIVIESEPKFQNKYDSLYQSYLNDKHRLSRNEIQQIGFRLGKRLGLKRLYCEDAWGADYDDVKNVVEGKDSIARKKFMHFFYHNPDSLLMSSRNDKPIFMTKGILAELKQLNSDSELTRSLGDYLIGVFKYETPENNQFGPDFTTGWWFNRNLRIFRNIQRISTNPDDRILVIFGAGHMNLLNIFFKASPEYQLLKVNDYLK